MKRLAAASCDSFEPFWDLSLRPGEGPLRPDIERVSRIAILLLFRRALQTSIDIVETGPRPLRAHAGSMSRPSLARRHKIDPTGSPRRSPCVEIASLVLVDAGADQTCGSAVKLST